MSALIAAIPPQAIATVCAGMIGWVGHMAWHHTERAHVARGMTLIRQFMRGNDDWFAQHVQLFAQPAAIEAGPEHVDAEVLHVEHPTGELRVLTADDPDLAKGWANLADEVGLAQALSDEPEHDDEDAPADDTDRPGLWLVLLAIPVALWVQLVAWFRSLGASRRERHLIGSGEQATDRDPFAELLAHVEASPTTEPEERAVELEAWRSAVAERQIVAAMYEQSPTPYKPWHLHDVTAQYEQVRPGRHRAIVPAQRDGGDE